MGDTACPEGYIPTGKKCPGTGTCCRASWTKSCGEGCAKAKCDAFKGEWIPLDYKTNPYTCETTGGDVKKVVETILACDHLLDSASGWRTMPTTPVLARCIATWTG